MNKKYLYAGAAILILIAIAFGAYYVGRNVRPEDNDSPNLEDYLSALEKENVYSLRSIKVGDNLGVFKVSDIRASLYPNRVDGEFTISLLGQTYIKATCKNSTGWPAGWSCRPADFQSQIKIPKILEQGVVSREFNVGESPELSLIKPGPLEPILILMKDPTLVYVSTEKTSSAMIIDAEILVQNPIVEGEENRSASFANLERLVVQNLLLEIEGLSRSDIIFFERKITEYDQYQIRVGFKGKERLYSFQPDGTLEGISFLTTR